MKKIYLAKGKYTIIDDDDFNKVSQFNWWIVCGYAARVITINPIKGNKKKKIILLHRFIKKAKRGQVIDHKDGNRINNQKDNLRFCTMAQNKYNQRPYKNHRYKGINTRNYKGKISYRCRIRHEGKLIALGTYKTEIEVALAYNEAAKKYFGEFAYLNDTRR